MRCRGERGFALLKGRWRTLKRVTASPGKIGDITRAALVLTHFEHGYMFWAAGQPSAHGTNTFPPDTCQGGVGVGSSTYSVPFPMPALRQS